MKVKEISLNRFIAKGIDFFVVAFFWTILSYVDAPYLGIFAAIGYILIADGFFEGQSLGKKLIRLKVVVIRGEDIQKCTFKSSIIRNALLTVILFSAIPIVGWFIFFPLGLLIMAIESYFSYSDEQGRRIGDVLAGTNVIQTSGDLSSKDQGF